MKSSLRLAALVAVSMTAACGGYDSMNAPDGMGTVLVQLTDAPFPFDSVAKVEVHLVRVDARIADADDAAADANVNDNSQGGWVEIARPDKVVELLALQGGKLASLGSTQVAVGTYRGLRRCGASTPILVCYCLRGPLRGLLVRRFGTNTH